MSDSNAYVTAVGQRIFHHEEQRQRELKENLITANENLGGSSLGFSYNLVKFSLLSDFRLQKQSLPEVREELKQEVHEFWLQHSRLEKDRRAFRQAFTTVLSRCTTQKQLLEVLPDLSTQGSVRLKTPPDGDDSYLFCVHPLRHPQYRKVLEIAEYYTALRLIF
jgi:hypothetical protein